MPKWKILNQLVKISSPWVTLIGERVENGEGQVLDYWRVEKADSVVIVTIQGRNFLLPVPQYRPGVQEITLDFPGGRVGKNQSPVEAVPGILARELGIAEAAIATIALLNPQGWAINSSFSNQKLYGCVAHLQLDSPIPSHLLGATYPLTPQGEHHLLEHLTCLQCRAVFREWQSRSHN